MRQITSRVSDELEAALDRWAAAEGRPRSELIREVLAEAADAYGQGRAMFTQTDSINPKDIQQILSGLREQHIELQRILEQNIKRDAALVRRAREDTLGVSEARTAIVSRINAEIQQVRDATLAAIARLPAEQADALSASPALTATAAALDGQAQALRQLTALAKRWFEEPKTYVTYTIWDRKWPGGMVLAALGILWLVSVGSFFALAMLVPGLGVRSANKLLGGGNQAICALVNHRMATDTCHTQLKGGALKVKVQAEPAAARTGR